MVCGRRVVVVPNALNVIVGIIERAVGREIIVSHVVHALVRLHDGIAFLALVLFLPSLGIRQQLVEIHTEELRRGLTRAIRCDKAGAQLVWHRREVGKVCRLVPAKLHVVFHPHLLSLLTALCGDKYHAERGTRAIDGRRRGVFQHRDAGNVVGAYHRQVVDRHAINHDEWRRVLAV